MHKIHLPLLSLASGTHKVESQKLRRLSVLEQVSCQRPACHGGQSPPAPSFCYLCLRSLESAWAFPVSILLWPHTQHEEG